MLLGLGAAQRRFNGGGFRLRRRRGVPRQGHHALRGLAGCPGRGRHLGRALRPGHLAGGGRGPHQGAAAGAPVAGPSGKVLQCLRQEAARRAEPHVGAVGGHQFPGDDDVGDVAGRGAERETAVPWNRRFGSNRDPRPSGRRPHRPPGPTQRWAWPSIGRHRPWRPAAVPAGRTCRAGRNRAVPRVPACAFQSRDRSRRAGPCPAQWWLRRRTMRGPGRSRRRGRPRCWGTSPPWRRRCRAGRRRPGVRCVAWTAESRPDSRPCRSSRPAGVTP